MDASKMLGEEALQLILNLDEAAYEAFTRGVITAKEYHELVPQIASLQLTLGAILDALE
jgi:hypothetical protein